MLHKESDFEYAAQRFLSTFGEADKTYSMYQPSSTSPGTRIMTVDGNLERKFIVKVHKEPFPMDKSSPYLQNEILAQSVLENLGYPSKKYLLVDFGTDNVTESPLTVSTFIPGQTLENAESDVVGKAAPKVLDYLFNVHSRTTSATYGYMPGIQIDRPNSTFTEFESSYLVADINRDRIDFSSEEQRALEGTIASLDCAKQFCLCHCDVTLRNTLHDSGNVNLIDWSYCHYSEPGFDIANVVFWLLECDLYSEVKQELLRSEDRYDSLGFNIAPSFLFYLSQRYIEYGRLKGHSYIEKGKNLQTSKGMNSVQNIINQIYNLRHTQRGSSS